MTAHDYLELVASRQRMIDVAQRRLSGFDAWLMPTVPLVAPLLAELEADEGAFLRANALVLRNPSVINFIDGCALSLPCQGFGELPVGLSIAGLRGADAEVLQIVRAVEDCLVGQG